VGGFNPAASTVRAVTVQSPFWSIAMTCSICWLFSTRPQ
jgi:hypothetical protein